MRDVGIGKRQLVKLAAGASGLGLAAAVSAAVARSSRHADYDAAAEGTWQPVRPMGAQAGAFRELVRCATLAANSHNTQPWRFRVAPNRIEVAADLGRRCPAVDPDEHHLFVSLGCATENIVQAAPSCGLRARPSFEMQPRAVHIELEPARDLPGELLGAIARRQCTRAEYDGRPVPPDHLRLLEGAGRGPGVEMLLFTERRWLESFLPLLLAANAAQMNDSAFIAELKTWIRFGYVDAVATRDGLFSGASGSPVVPAMLGRLIFDLAFTVDGETTKYERQLRSSAGIAVFVAEQSDRAHWVEVGRCYQRFALQAEVLGLRHAFLNQPVEVPSVRGDFAALAGIPGRRPDLVVRFGYGPSLPRSLRRPVDQVLT